MELKYAFNPGNKEKTAKAVGRDMNISPKDAIMISKKIRGMTLSKAISYLEKVVNLEATIPYTRFQIGIGHRQGSGSKIAKYPQKAADEILNVLRSVESNATYKGLDSEKLKIVHAEAQRGVIRPGRKPKGRWKLWRKQFVHFQVVVGEK